MLLREKVNNRSQNLLQKIHAKFSNVRSVLERHALLIFHNTQVILKINNEI